MDAFNPGEFSLLLRKLIGSRKVGDFALETGLSRFQLSRRLSGKLSSAPRKNTLKTLASHAQGGVTYEMLLSACGYTEEISAPASREENVRFARAALLSGTDRLRLSVQICAKAPQIPCDFELRIGDAPPLTWDFICLDESPAYAIEQQVNQAYLALIRQRLSAYYKLSFMTPSQKTFDECIKNAPYQLSVNISVILYAKENLDILSEETLSCSLTDPCADNLSFGENGPKK